MKESLDWSLYCGLQSSLSLYVSRLPARADGLGLLCLLDCMTHLYQITGQAMVGVRRAESWGSFSSKALGFSVPNAALLGLQLFQFRLAAGTPTNTKRRIFVSQAPVNKSEKEHEHSNGLALSQRKKKRGENTDATIPELHS